MATVNPDEVRQRARLEWKLAAPGWKKWEKQLLSQMQPMSDQLIQSAGIVPGHYVLDVATGTGEPALTIAKFVGPQGRVVGVDISPEMLEVAKERANSQRLNNVTFQDIQDENLSEFQDATFDAVVCRLGLMLMPDPVKALRAFLRVLKPGRKASVTVPGAPEKTPFMALPMKAIAKHIPDFKPPPPGTPGFFAIPSLQALQELFLKAEFSNFTGQVDESGRVRVESAEEYWQMGTEITGVLALVFAKLPEEKKQAIREEVIATVKNMFPSGPPELKIETVFGTGTKP